MPAVFQVLRYVALCCRRGATSPTNTSSISFFCPVTHPKPPPLHGLYDPDPLVGIQGLPCSCTLTCLSVTSCRSLSCILCVPARLGHTPSFPTSSSVIMWLPAGCPPLCFSPVQIVLICDSTQRPSPPGILLFSPLVHLRACVGSTPAREMLYCLPVPQSVPLISLPVTVSIIFLPCSPCPLFVGKVGACRILYSHLST